MALVLTRDVDGLRQRLLLTPRPCVEGTFPLSVPCRDDQPAGTVVDAFDYGSCDGAAAQDETVLRSILERLVAQVTGVYAIYQSSTHDTFGVIFTTIENDKRAMLVVIEGEQIQRLFLGCYESPVDLLPEMSERLILKPITWENGDG